MKTIKWRIECVLCLTFLSAHTTLGRPPDLETGRHVAAVSRVFFSSKGQEIVSLSWDGTIRTWELATGKSLSCVRLPLGHQTLTRIAAADLMSDRGVLAIGGRFETNDIFLISLTSQRIIKRMVGHTSVVNQLHFSPDGLKLLSASADKTARLWDVKTGECELILQGHTDGVRGAVFSPDGALCATTSSDGSASIWRVKDGKRVSVLKGHSAPVTGAAWSPDSTMVVTGSYDRSIRVWSRKGELKATLKRKEMAPISSLSFIGETPNVLFTQMYSTSRITWGIVNLNRNEFVHLSDDHPNTILCSAVNSDDALVATGDFYGNIYVWDTRKGRLKLRISGFYGLVNPVAWSKDGRSIAWGTREDVLGPRRLKRSFNLHLFSLNGRPTSDYLGARTKDDKVSLTLANQTSVKVQKNGKEDILIDLNHLTPQDHVQCYSLLTGSRAVIGGNYSVDIFDLANGRRIRSLEGQPDMTHSVCPSPDDKLILTGSGPEYTVRVWSTDTGRLLVSFFFTGDEWAAWTELGFYAASPGGEKFLGWQVDRDNGKFSHFVPAEQMRKTFHRPDILKAILATGDLVEGLRKCGAGFVNVNHYFPPNVHLKARRSKEKRIGPSHLEVTATIEQLGDYPINSAHVILDGKPLEATKRMIKPQLFVREIRASFSIPLSPNKRHAISVRADTSFNHGISNTIVIPSDP